NTSGFGADPWLYLYRWSRLFPIGVQEDGQDIIDPAYSARMSNDAVSKKKFLNLNIGTTLNLTKNWDVQTDYAYSTENETQKTSVPYLQAKTHWDGVEAARTADGSLLYVDENGNPVSEGGMQAYRFPLTDHTTKENTYFYQNSWEHK